MVNDKSYIKPQTRVLAYRPGSLGDTIIAIAALNAIRSYFGVEAYIELLTDQDPAKEVTAENIMNGHSCVNSF